MITKSIKDVMTTEVVSVSPETLIIDAATLMTEQQISCLLTLDDGKPSGIFTERDLLYAASRDIDASTLSIRHLRQHPVITGKMELDIYEAFDLLIERHIRHLVIVDDTGRLSGLVTFSNLVRATELDGFLQCKPISDVMTRDPQTIQATESLQVALSLMEHKGISCVIITEGDRPVGLLTERDATSLIRLKLDNLHTPVSAVMSTPVETPLDQDPVHEVSKLMQKRRFRHAVVVNSQGKLVGVVSQYDLIKGVQGKYIKSLQQHLSRKNAELKKAQEHLLEQKQLNHIVEHVPVIHYACAVKEDGLSPYYVSPNIEKLLGYSAEGCIHDQAWWRSILHAEDAEEVLSSFRSTLKTGKHRFESEYRIYKADGSLAWIRDEMSIMRDATGEISELIGSWMDITDRKSSEQNFQLVVKTLIDPIVIHRAGRVVFINPAGVRLIGAESEDQILGTRVFEYLIPECRQLAAQRINDVITKGITAAPVEETFQRLDNKELVSAEVSSAPIHYHGQSCVLSAFHDITKRKHAEKSVLILSQAIEQAGESILITDREGVIEYVNPAFTKITGYSAEESIGKTPRMLHSGNHDRAFYEGMWKTITSGKVWQGKVIDRKKDGSFIPAMLTISPIFDQSGDNSSYSHFVGIQSDLSEFEDMEQRFYQAQKMEAIGTLVGGIAHDFNNMLAGITGNLFLAKKRVGWRNPDAVENLENIEELSFHASEMIQQLLTFARKDLVNKKRFPLSTYVKETLKLLHTSVPENIELTQSICHEDLPINGDTTRLHQLLMNLVNNAVDALEGEDSPCIAIKLDSFISDDRFIEKHGCDNGGNYAHLSVKDNGCGIPEHQIEHLFEPFFTTKEQGKGTGLGLPMVFGATKTHGGFVDVESNEGEGSVFHIYLPLHESATYAPESEVKEGAVEGHGETILIVDDEKHVVDTSREVLEALGYRVLTATNGQEAVNVFKAHADIISLCVFDIVMPVMSGYKAAGYIRQLNPHVKIIFSSGYDKVEADKTGHEIMLAKPFSVVKMSHLIRKELDS